MVDDNEESFKCPLPTIETMEKFFSVKHGPDGKCRPCFLRPLTELYMGVLEDAGEKEKAGLLSTTFENSPLLTIARTMDNIKAGVGNEIRQHLLDLDCLCQVTEANSGEVE